MEFDELKHNWDAVKTPVKSIEAIRAMLAENRHPVLKEIRKQLTLEIAGWSVFLLCYYTMFDGHLKPVWINLILIIAVLMPFIHNIMGYRFVKYLVDGKTIRESLEHYLVKMRVYAIVSIISRVLFMTGLLVFFTYGLGLNGKKYIFIIIVPLIFLFMLFRIWSGRLAKLKKQIAAFD
ncbi:hypothetical protein [Niabella beijingensis]|uniref:hypothetical protein n=1 Tax=Niabella beijingensis TaxID=2872700 RepID=UPI001CBB5235|nr:hypothetical protein [Niabella beijingensis]MBZ4188464.1 hypothetical protein [Niabella beijingensis]